MNKSLYLMSFVAGALVGSAASWLILKKKYEKITQEEIKSVKEAFSQKLVDDMAREWEENNEEAVLAEEFAEVEAREKEYHKILKETGYAGEELKEPNYIQIISPVDLGSMDDYDIVSLTYYADEVLADDDGNIIDPADTVGAFALTQFGEYDDDAIHVRNGKLKIDYEVLLDERYYSEVFEKESDN